MKAAGLGTKVAAGAAASTVFFAGPAYASCGAGIAPISYDNYGGYNACRASDIQDAPITGYSLTFVDPYACGAPFDPVASSGGSSAEVSAQHSGYWTVCAANSLTQAVRENHLVVAMGSSSCDAWASAVRNSSYHAVYITGYKATTTGAVQCNP